MSNPWIIVNDLFYVFSDKIEVLFPVNIQKINPGGTKLVPASLLTPSLNKSISGNPVVSTTLHQLIKFANSNQLILKLDIEGFECKVLRPYFENPIKDVYIPYIFMEWSGVKQNVD